MAATRRTVAESGFKVSTDSATSFRLADLEPYRKLSGLHLKEMDIGWWDSSTSRIILLELKGSGVWDAFDSSREHAHDHLVANLRDKATDAMMILASVWVGTTRGKEMKKLLPANVRRYPGDGKIKLIFLVDTPRSRKPLLSAINDEVNRKAAGRSRLFGVPRVTVVDFDVATRMNLPVTRLR